MRGVYMKINGIITAAGLSSRMQAFKPLLKPKGKTMIECSVDSMLDAGVSEIVVVLGYRAGEVEGLLRDKYDSSRVICVNNPLYKESDMLESVKTGIKGLSPCDAFYILPGDMPAIHQDTFRILTEEMSRMNAVAAFPIIDGHREHPPLISWDFKDKILEFHGEGGLREVFKQLENKALEVSVEDPGCRMDADTKDDYEKLVSYIAKAF
jgi:CTP:molybdopterin cytidylyltransferase MocA